MDVPLTVREAMERWRPGSYDWGWPEELADIRQMDAPRFDALVDSIRRNGLRRALPAEEPIMLGDDGRVWSGHHRLLAAHTVDPDTPLPPDIEFGGETPVP